MMIRWREVEDARSTSSQQTRGSETGELNDSSDERDNNHDASSAIFANMRTESEVGHDITDMATGRILLAR